MLGQGRQRVTGALLLSPSVFYLWDENAKAKPREPADGSKGLGQLGEYMLAKSKMQFLV